ncbi:MAG: excinuclease ABC subunit C, partial [Acidobacteriota bacterium]
EEYERAARYRDLLRACDELARGQHVEIAGSGSVDVVALEGDGRDATAVVLLYREGRLVDKREYHWEGAEMAPNGEFLGTFLAQYYQANPAIPERIEVSWLPDDADTLREFLRERRGAPVRLLAPKRGTRVRVLALALENAREAFRLRFRHPRREGERIGEDLATTLGLASRVERIECFDISHLGGEAQVASLVVWERGALRKGEYRSFNVRAGAGADDPAAIAEAVERRYRRRLREGAALPDLVLVDGGMSQLAAAESALARAGSAIAVASLAKRLEEVFLPGRSTPLHLESHNPSRLLLQRLRDEAHRFAITRHRRRRKARRLATQLLAVPGIGPRRAQLLLSRFGSLDGVRAADRSALDEAIGACAAAALWLSLHVAAPEPAPQP